jgi:hydrogenase maturation protease
VKERCRILVAGIGNIFEGDDAFGCEVARALMQKSLPDGVVVDDFGIRSYDLAYAITSGFDAAILVDAVSRGGLPGTVYLIEPTAGGADGHSADPHGLDVSGVLQMACSFGGDIARLYLVGCQPENLESDRGELGLSETVRAAVPQAIAMIESLLGDLLSETPNLYPGIAQKPQQRTDSGQEAMQNVEGG